MSKELIISKGQEMLAFLENKEARQLLVVAVTPIILLAGYYVLVSPSDDPATHHDVLSQSTANDRQAQHIESNQASQANQQDELDNDSEAKDPIDKTILVDVSGAVSAPGLKELKVGDRVADAIQSAGGLNAYADKQYIAQALNLAQKLNDGDKVYLPTYYEVSLGLQAPVKLANKVGDPMPVIVASNKQKDNQKADKAIKEAVENSNMGDGLVNINTASQSELEELPGIGEKYAEYIIKNRPYSNKNDICISEIVNNTATCDEIQELIAL